MFVLVDGSRTVVSGQPPAYVSQTHSGPFRHVSVGCGAVSGEVAAGQLTEGGLPIRRGWRRTEPVGGRHERQFAGNDRTSYQHAALGRQEQQMYERLAVDRNSDR